MPDTVERTLFLDRGDFEYRFKDAEIRVNERGEHTVITLGEVAKSLGKKGWADIPEDKITPLFSNWAIEELTIRLRRDGDECEAILLDARGGDKICEKCGGSGGGPEPPLECPQCKGRGKYNVLPLDERLARLRQR